MTLAAPPSPSRPRPTPLFVLGAPRSGTTFLQQVIDAHPEVLISDELRAASWLVQEAGKLREGRTVHGNPYPLTRGQAFAEYLLGNAGRILLPQASSGKVRPGQTARIKFDSYPFMEYGMVNGRVTAISAVARDDRYSVEVAFPAGLTTSYGKQIEFKQGMQGTAEIVTEDLRLLGTYRA